MNLFRSKRSLGWVLAAAAIVPAVVFGLKHVERMIERSRFERVAGLKRATVQRADLHVAVTAGGHVDSSDKTLIECELESLTVASEGRSFSARGASTIIELIPEGSQVQSGDVLCRFDSSEFAELVRQQEIQVQRARSDLQKSEFDLKAAEMAYVEYREGLLPQQRDQLEAQLTVASSDIERQRARLTWVERMVRSGYYSLAQVANEKLTLQRAEILLNRALRQRTILEEFDSKTRILQLDVALNRARGEVDFQRLKLQRREEQLVHFQKQIERCTVRAPHDGFVVYANDDDGDPRVELGATVHQRMDLFYLPNLDRMQVITRLNESVVGRIGRGMSALVRLEALPDYEIEGQVEMVTALPLFPSGRASPDVRTYVARIKLDNAPRGLRPGMSAEVRILTERRPNAVIIPSNSVAFESGSEVCYLPLDTGLERRRVSVAAATPQWLEVTDGLKPGEEVVLDPTAIESDIQIVRQTELDAPEARPPLDTASAQ